MALSIKDPETERSARELAAATGKSVTAAVTEALERSLRETVDREAGRDAEREAIFQRTMAISRETGALLPAEFKTFDHDAWLYDEDGLPR